MGLFRRRPATTAPDDTPDLHIPSISNKELMEWGMPSRCPECGAYGYLDRIDLIDEVMYQHCPSCWTHWTITKQEIELSAAQGAPPPEWT